MDISHESVALRYRVDECLSHYFSILGQKLFGSVPQAKAAMMKFCGVSKHTIERWSGKWGGTSPQGERWLTLAIFFDFIGYEVIEVKDEMPSSHRMIAELVAFKLLTTQQAAELIGYANVDSLVQILQGAEGSSEEKRQIMREMWNSRHEELRRKKEEMRQMLGLPANGSAQAQQEREKEPTVQVPSKVGCYLQIVGGYIGLLVHEDQKGLEKHAGKIRELVSQLSEILTHAKEDK